MGEKIPYEKPTAVILMPVRSGHWVLDENVQDFSLPGWKCSECGYTAQSIPAWVTTVEGDIRVPNPLDFAGSKYCGDCGARMDGRVCD